MLEPQFRPIPILTPTQIEVFHNRVAQSTSDDCWLWQGTRIKGYGNIRFDGHNFRAHRIAYFLHHGTNVGGVAVLHRCDNPPCVNPQHLFTGTYADNNKDRAAKGRSAKTKRWYKFGSQIPSSKLKESQVIEILNKHQQGTGIRPLGREYKVTPLVIRLIVQSWRHIKWHGVAKTTS